MANKRKATTAIVAGVTAVALLLGGTFAWTSISQTAKNEAIVDINPGGRLHDDFNGTNKDVYVENFGDTTTGVPIFARIRLDQYFEVGQDAGTNKGGTARKVTQVLGTDINNVETWVTYKPGDLSDTSKVQANGNWNWKLGRTEDEVLPYYMPTFNKNKDSLAADINGTYEGTIVGDIVHYDDYVQYGSAEQAANDTKIVATKTDTEVYDHDSNTTEEGKDTIADGFKSYATDSTETPIDDAHVRYNAGQTHTATQITSGATVMTMQAWIDAGSVPGPYWVYDTDGWAYWAQAIEPTMTTGLLLDSIQMTKVPDDNYYYGINVVAQFATAGDIQAFNSGKTDDETWTAEAEDLFAKITNTETVTIDGAERVVPGGTATYAATRMVAGTAAANQPTFTWTATDANGDEIADVTMTDGTLTVGDSVADGTEITVTATAGDGTAAADGETKVLSASKTVTVMSYQPMSLTILDGGETVTMQADDTSSDSIDWEYEVGNAHGVTETIKLTLNREIDVAATESNTDNAKLANAGISFEFDGSNTVNVTFTGSEFLYGVHDDDGVFRAIARLYIHTEKEKLTLTFLEAFVEDADMQMQYLANGAEGDASALPTALKAGDQIVSYLEKGEKYSTVWNNSVTYVFYDTEGKIIYVDTLASDKQEYDASLGSYVFTIPAEAVGAEKVRAIIEALPATGYSEHRRYFCKDFTVSITAADETT